MSLKAPDWLTAELISEVLGGEVTSVGFSAAAPPGSSYGSVVTRVRVTLRGRENPISLIVKSELTEGHIKDAFDLPNTIEHDFYYKFLPEAGKISDTSFVAKTFPTSRASSVILEDLTCLGFKMADRIKQLDFDHCRLYIMAAAKLHALSFVVDKKNPESLVSIREEKLFSNDLKSTAAFWKKMVDGGIANLLKATDGSEKFKRARRVILGIQEHLWNMIVEAHKKSEGINTINQSDPWTTNMMFRYDENGVVQEIKLLDFQCPRFASPVNDIVFFIWCSANHDVKTSRLSELYKIYLRCFNEYLTNLGCRESYSEEDFMEGIRKLSPMVLLLVASMYPVLSNPLPMDTDQLFKDEVEFYRQYYNVNFCSYDVPKSMEQMKEAGVFDYLELYLNQF